MAKTIRLDVAVVEQGLLPSRQVAQAAIMDGGVIVNGQKITKPGTAIALDSKIEITSNWQVQKYVSRGGFKLERALDVFQVNVEGRICLDLGASTGGFTDCLLQRGARLVYAIDVGFGQLAGSLRQDSRVVVKERMNARHVSPEELYAEGERATLAVADLSFISLTKILPATIALLKPDEAEVVSLIKPQFEAGKALVGKGGVVRAPETHQQVLEETCAAARELGLKLQGLTYSPVKGPAGNIEFLAHWTIFGEEQSISIAAIVTEAHQVL